MGIIYPGGIKISSPIRLEANKPLHESSVVATYADLDNLEYKYPGLITKVLDEDEFYTYHLDNTWTLFGSDVIIQETKDVSDDIWMAGVAGYVEDGAYGRFLAYKTDDFRYLDLYELIPEAFTDKLYVVNNISRNGNDFFFEGQLGTDTNVIKDRFTAAFYDCQVVDNVLVPGRTAFKRYTGLLDDYNGGRVTVHKGEYQDGFLYYMTRPNTTNTTIPIQIIKFNAYNLEDYQIYTLPSTLGYYSLTNAFQIYKDWIYILVTKTETTVIPASGGIPATTQGNLGVGYMVRVSTDLRTSEVVFQAEVPGAGLDKVEHGNYFLIHNDEIIIPISNTENAFKYRNTIGLSFYTMDGKLKRKKSGMQYSNVISTTNRPAIHWMTIFNNKVILSRSASSSTNCGLIRIEAGHGYDNNSIVYEDFWAIQGGLQWTNDNSITRDGDLMMNPEGSFATSTGMAIVNYKDFTDYQVIEPLPDLVTGWYSNASLNPFIIKESLKAKLSDFGDYPATGFIPFTGAISDVDLNSKNLKSGTLRLFNGVGATNYWQINSGGIDSLLFTSPEGDSFYFNTALLSGTKTYQLPDNSGVIPLSISVNGGTSVTPNTVTGNIDLSLSLSGTTNLSYIASPTNGTVVSDTGTDAVIPLGDNTNAGLIVAGGNAKLAVLSGTNTGDNATNTTSNSYADGKVADSITDGITGVAPSQNAVFDALGLKSPLASPALTGTPTAPTAVPGTNTTQLGTTAFVQAAINALLAASNTWSGISNTFNGNLLIGNNSTIGNSANSARGLINIGSGTVSTSLTRNTTDAIATFILNNANAGSTGAMLELQALGVTKAKINKTGDIEVIDATAGIILKDAGDASRRRITIVNGVLTVSTAL